LRNCSCGGYQNEASIASSYTARPPASPKSRTAPGRLPSISHASAPSARRGPVLGAELERCIYCAGATITRKGKRYKKLETIQLWFCHTCNRVFTPQIAKGKTYPLKVILEALKLYYRGHTIPATIGRLKKRYGLAIAPRTLTAWLTEHRPLTTYHRLRNQAGVIYRPHQLIRTTRLHHQQVYTYRLHQRKLALILNTQEHRAYLPLADYLTEMAERCPHHLFQEGGRASKGGNVFNIDGVEIREKDSLASRITELVLQTVTNNRRRHDELQHFMVATDSVTVAVEVPIILTPDDIVHMQRQLGFHIPIETDTTLTGHIDVLQVRNGRVHILDYKPGAAKEKPIAQLMVYALALSRRTGLRLYDFVCAWFDEHHYFEFYPLHVVHKRPSKKRG
jgi:hypothetical protein